MYTTTVKIAESGTPLSSGGGVTGRSHVGDDLRRHYGLQLRVASQRSHQARAHRDGHRESNGRLVLRWWGNLKSHVRH